jgi:hypothetical protein
MKPAVDLRKIPQALRDVGAEHISTRHNKHVKVTFAVNGLRRFVVFAGSTANYFSKANVIALFRRELRALGIQKRFQL